MIFRDISLFAILRRIAQLTRHRIAQLTRHRIAQLTRHWTPEHDLTGSSPLSDKFLSKSLPRLNSPWFPSANLCWHTACHQRYCERALAVHGWLQGYVLSTGKRPLHAGRQSSVSMRALCSKCGSHCGVPRRASCLLRVTFAGERALNKCFPHAGRNCGVSRV